MPREKGDPKAKLFDRLIAQGEEPVAAAKQAGVKRPGEYVAKRAKRNAKRTAAVTSEVAPADDRSIAKAALRQTIALGTTDATIVRASSELLKHTPASSAASDAQRAIVVFTHSNCDVRPGPCYRFDGVDHESVKAAVALASEIKSAGRSEALEAFALTHAIDIAEWSQILCALEVDSVRRAFEFALAAALSQNPTLRARIQAARETN